MQHLTKAGRFCGVRPPETCTYHPPEHRRYPKAAPPTAQPDQWDSHAGPDDPSEPAQAPAPLSEAYELALERRDLRSVLWLALEGVIRLIMDEEKRTGPVATLSRVILAVGAEETGRETGIAEAAVIGAVLHGIAPRDEAGWEIARRNFDDYTLSLLDSWVPEDGWVSTLGGHRVRRADAAAAQPEHEGDDEPNQRE